MNPNNIPNWTVEQAIYIHNNSEVNSKLWRETGYVLSAYQQGMQSKSSNQNEGLLDSLTEYRKGGVKK